ncbi:class I SAM-dependent methyltransferase [Pseudoroseomonas wenyumeiae]
MKHSRDVLEQFAAWTSRLSLGREIAPEEVHGIIDDLSAGADPISYFLSVANSEEAKRRREAPGNVSTLFPIGHFYSPVVDPAELLNSNFNERRSKDQLAGVEIDYDRMEIFFRELLSALGNVEIASNAESGRRYYPENDMYGMGDALVLASMVRHLKPKRWIEVGSGFSSAVLLDTLDQSPDLTTQLTFIEPFPDRLMRLLRGSDQSRVALIHSGIQQVDLNVFRALEKDDVLFLDTTHVTKTGSDVNFEVFSILPILSSGVVVHFHDIFADFEYPEEWIYKQNRSWNESYLLRAFLMYNRDFEVIYFNDGFAKHRATVFREQAPQASANPGGIWLRKK